MVKVQSVGFPCKERLAAPQETDLVIYGSAGSPAVHLASATVAEDGSYSTEFVVPDRPVGRVRIDLTGGPYFRCFEVRGTGSDVSDCPTEFVTFAVSS